MTSNDNIICAEGTKKPVITVFMTLHENWLMVYDGQSGDRTLDPRIKSPLLCQLS